jgi:hypothetical protein
VIGGLGLDRMKMPDDVQIEFGIKTKQHASHNGYRQHTNETRPIHARFRLAEELKNRKAVYGTSGRIAAQDDAHHPMFGHQNAPYKSGRSKAWLKIKNPKAPAATRALDGTF